MANKNLSPVSIWTDSKDFRTEVQQRGYRRAVALLRDMTSVYKSAVLSPNYALEIKQICEETARAEIGAELVLADGHLADCRSDFLFRNFGFVTHFQDPKFFPQVKNDFDYRKFLLSLILVLRGGTRQPALEDGIKLFTDLSVEVIRLWTLLNEFGGPLGIEMNNMIWAAVDIPQPVTVDLDFINDGMRFILELDKPAEALYDARLRLTEDFNIDGEHDDRFPPDDHGPEAPGWLPGLLLADRSLCHFINGNLSARWVIKDVSPENEPSSYIDAIVDGGVVKGPVTAKFTSPDRLMVGTILVYIQPIAVIKDENGVALGFNYLKVGDIVTCFGSVINASIVNGFQLKAKDSRSPRTLCNNWKLTTETYHEEPWLWCQYEDVPEIPIATMLTLVGIAGTPILGDTAVGSISGAQGVVVGWDLLQNIIKLWPTTGTFDVTTPDVITLTGGATGVLVSVSYGEDISWQLNGSHQHDTFYTRFKPLTKRDGYATLDWMGTTVEFRVNGLQVTPDYVNPLVGKIVIPVGAALPPTHATGSLTGLPEGAAGVQDGDTVVISDGITSQTFEFDSNGVAIPGNTPITIVVGFTAAQVAVAIYVAVNSLAWGVHASPPDASNVVDLRGPVTIVSNVPITESIASMQTLTPVGMAGAYPGDKVEISYVYARRPVYPLEGDLPEFVGDTSDELPYQFIGDVDISAQTRQTVTRILSGLLPPTYTEVILGFREWLASWYDRWMRELCGYGISWGELYGGACSPFFFIHRLSKTESLPESQHIKPCNTPTYEVEWDAFELAYTAIGDWIFGLQGDTYDNLHNHGDHANVVRTLPDPSTWGNYGVYYGGANSYGNPSTWFDKIKFRYTRYMPEVIVEATQDVVNALNQVFTNHAFVPSGTDVLNNVDHVLNNINLLLNESTIIQVRHYMQALYGSLIASMKIKQNEGCCRVKPIRQVDVEWRMQFNESYQFYDAQEARLLWGDDGRQRPDGSFYNAGI